MHRFNSSITSRLMDFLPRTAEYGMRRLSPRQGWWALPESAHLRVRSAASTISNTGVVAPIGGLLMDPADATDLCTAALPARMTSPRQCFHRPARGNAV